MAELCDKPDLLLDLIPVCVIGPEEDIERDSHSLPNELNGAILDIGHRSDYVVTFVLLDRRQSNVQEANSWGQANEWHEKDWVQSDQVWEGDSVQELDLDQRVLRVDIEVNVHHDVEDDDQGKDN